MAAPSPATRVDPVGIKLKDGYRTLITLSADTDVSFWEKSVKPPAYDGGDPIDQTTMHNDTVRTKAPRSLIDIGVVSGRAAFDPAVKTQILALLNVETTVTIRYSDGSTEACYGYLRLFDTQEMVEGTQPEANFEIVVTNWDPTNKVEAVPAIASVAGT